MVVVAVTPVAVAVPVQGGSVVWVGVDGLSNAYQQLLVGFE
jgi:hypothetical protein